MEKETLLLFGAGGQAKVVIDAVAAAGNPFLICVVDEDPSKHGQTILGHAIMAPLENLVTVATAFHVAVGGNAARERIYRKFEAHGYINRTIMHPKACVSVSARIGAGTFIAASSIVGPDAQIERCCIVNHGAVVDHDCRVGGFSHVAPNATLGGGVVLGKRVMIGAGANILPGVSIGDDCVIGAGAVVLKNIDAGSVHIGVPARNHKK